MMTETLSELGLLSSDMPFSGCVHKLKQQRPTSTNGDVRHKFCNDMYA